MQQQILDLLLKEEEVTWKTILYDLVKTEQMDPWDINVTLLTKKYIDVIKKMQEHNFRISGKILLAAAFLLKIKSAHLIDHDISNLDRLIQQTEEVIDEEFLDELEERQRKEKVTFALVPRNPQPRTRKMSIHDLVSALQQAMATKKRILAQQRPVKFHVPEKKIDITQAIRDIFHKITYYAQKDKSTTVSFSRLLPPKAEKQEKVYTFIPLLHLENERKIETSQERPFAEIFVKVAKGKKEPI